MGKKSEHVFVGLVRLVWESRMNELKQRQTSCRDVTVSIEKKKIDLLVIRF